jgi:FkbM family methyltransferase
MNVFYRAAGNILSLYPLSQSPRLLFNYARILIKNRLSSAQTAIGERLLDFRISFSRRITFLGQLHEIFLDRTYWPRGKDVTTIIDCGSNIGMSVLYFAWQYPDASILAFEPNPGALPYLNKNIEQNHLAQVTILPYALGKRDGVLELSIETKVDASAGATLVHAPEVEEGRAIVPVRVVRLSDYINGPVSFLKIDIEGTEGEVLEDLQETGKLSLVNELCLEYHYDGVHMKYPLQKIVDLLIHDGFECDYDKTIDFSKPRTKMLTTIVRAYH